MAGDRDGYGGAITAGVFIGLGALIAAAITNRRDPRQTFVERLQLGLQSANVALAASDLVRDQQQGLIWMVTLRLPTGLLLNLQAPVGNVFDAYDVRLADDIAERILRHLAPFGIRVS